MLLCYDKSTPPTMPIIDKNSKLGLFVSHVVPGVVRPMRVLWNEIIGFVFIVLAIAMVPGMLRAVRELETPQGSPGRLAIAAGFVLMLLYFGVSSFLRARKIGRS
jgi:hypothetical protein